MCLGLHAQKNQGGQVGRTAPNYPKQLQTSYISQCVHKTCTLCLTTLYTKEYTTYSSLTCFLVLLMLEVDRSYCHHHHHQSCKAKRLKNIIKKGLQYKLNKTIIVCICRLLKKGQNFSRVNKGGRFKQGVELTRVQVQVH